MSGREVDLRCYGILDPSRLKGRDPVRCAQEAASGGITLLQLRDKTSSTRAQVELARGLLEALAGTAVRLVINDRCDVALAAGAHGVHLGQDDLDPADARKLLGAEAVIGVTVHHPREADGVDREVADYAGVGPVFTTGSKIQKDLPIGHEGFRTLATRLRKRIAGFPICGIAGVTRLNAASVIDAGADGVAVISDVFMDDDIEQAARELRTTVDARLHSRKCP